MGLSERTIAISGAGRGLGAALAMVLADTGARPILLGRDITKLSEISTRIEKRGGQVAGILQCDLTSIEDCQKTAEAIQRDHPDCNGIVHNGAMWGGEKIEDQDSQKIFNIINSAVTGAVVLTRYLLPLLKSKPAADILTVGSISGKSHAPLRDCAAAFKAAKAAQEGFARGLAEELRETPIRVSAIHPGMIRDLMPDEPGWDAPRTFDDPMTDREVVDAIVFMLSAPANIVVRALEIERNTDFQLSPNKHGDD